MSKKTVTSFEEELGKHLKTSTGKQRIAWAQQIVDMGMDVKALSDVLLHTDRTTALRYTWMLSDIGIYSPATLAGVLPYLFEKRDKTSIKEFPYQFVKYWSIAGIPKENEGEATNLLFQWLTSPHTNVSTKTHAMQNLYTLTKEYPDLKGELKTGIEDQLDKNSVSFSNKAAKILLQLKN